MQQTRDSTSSSLSMDLDEEVESLAGNIFTKLKDVANLSIYISDTIGRDAVDVYDMYRFLRSSYETISRLKYDKWVDTWVNFGGNYENYIYEIYIDMPLTIMYRENKNYKEDPPLIVAYGSFTVEIPPRSVKSLLFLTFNPDIAKDLFNIIGKMEAEGWKLSDRDRETIEVLSKILRTIPNNLENVSIDINMRKESINTQTYIYFNDLNEIGYIGYNANRYNYGGVITGRDNMVVCFLEQPYKFYHPYWIQLPEPEIEYSFRYLMKKTRVDLEDLRKMSEYMKKLSNASKRTYITLKVAKKFLAEFLTR